MNKYDDIYYIIGGGESFLDVTEEEWKFLEDKHTIQFARVPYGNRKTEYYLSIERVVADKSVLKYMASQGWFDVKLLLYNTESVEYARELGFKFIQPIIKRCSIYMPMRLPWFVDEPKPPTNYYTTRAKNFKQPLFRYRGQLSAVINACVILGAKEIRLVGIDMNNQWNFYVRDNYKYLDLLCNNQETIDEFKNYMEEKNAIQRLKDKSKLNKDYNPNIHHTTNIEVYENRWGNTPMRGMSDVLEWTSDEMKNEGMRGIFITNKNSILYKDCKLDYKRIVDV